MNRFQRCALCIGLALLGCAAAFAEPPLTVVQDVLFNADGTTFNGIVTISWASFEASDMSNIPASSIVTEVINGLLRVQLVPTTNALSPSSYTVVYNSGGITQFTETWAVPPSNVSLPVSAVRISGTGTLVGGGGTGGSPTTDIAISDVTGLTTALDLRPSMGAGYTISRTAIIDASGAIDGAGGKSMAPVAPAALLLPMGPPASPSSTAKRPAERSTASTPASPWPTRRCPPPLSPSTAMACYRNREWTTRCLTAPSRSSVPTCLNRPIF